MNSLWWTRVLALVALVAVTAPAPIARADVDDDSEAAQDGPWIVGAGSGSGVLVDDYLKDATLDEAADQLWWCGVMPGCTAVWQEGVGTTVVLGRVAPDDRYIDPSDAIGDY